MPNPYQSNLNVGGIPAASVNGTVLVAAICGTDAADECTLAFTNANQVTVGNAIVGTNVAGPGTVVTINQPGVYYAALSYASTATGALNSLGITLNTNAAGRTDTPAMATAGIMDFGAPLAPAATALSTKLSAVFWVTKALAIAGAVVRFQAGAAGNATPAGGDVTIAECRFQVVRLGNII